MSKKYKLIFIAIIILFLITRLSGIDFVYHQDEHRWLLLADGTELGDSPHPPVTLTLLKITGSIFGFFNLRILSVFFSFINFWLIYLIVRRISNDLKMAIIATTLFAFNIYGLVSGLQVDMDGAILPFFILLGYYGYISLINPFRENSPQSTETMPIGTAFSKGVNGKNKKLSLFLLGAAIIGGILTKASFILFLGALATDYLIVLYENNKINSKEFINRTLRIVVPILGLVVLAYVFYSDRLQSIIDYAMNFKFFNFGSRAYLELGFKVAKSFVWLSPLLVLPMAFGLFIKEIRNRHRFWFIYILFNLIFYLVIFDFAKLPIERYFMFLIAPAVIIASDVIYYFYKKMTFHNLRKKILSAVGIFLAFVLLIFSKSYTILPLNPKGAYLDYVKGLNFDFLIPFSSSSGPIGFYFPAQFVFLSWIIATLLLVTYLLVKRNGYKTFLFITFLVFGLGYNFLFMNELLRGSIYGSPDKMVQQTLNYVLREPSITRIITYNDIAPYDLKKSGKYEARFYTAPERSYVERMKVFDGHYMIIDFPEIGKPGRYWNLIQRCDEIKRFTDKKINSYVFDCTSLVVDKLDKKP